jgi:hypothetical protein
MAAMGELNNLGNIGAGNYIHQGIIGIHKFMS